MRTVYTGSTAVVVWLNLSLLFSGCGPGHSWNASDEGRSEFRFEQRKEFQVGRNSPDIRQFATVLGCRLDSEVITDCLLSWNTAPDIVDSDGFLAGEIPVHDKGFDVVLAFNERWGKPRGDGSSPVWACYMRFFSPEYCQDKSITPYPEAIIDDIELPLTRDEVRSRFGVPSRSRRDAMHCDEYFYEDCIVRFCYPNRKDHVAFVELSRHSVVPAE